jgi:hypothetical protein
MLYASRIQSPLSYISTLPSTGLSQDSSPSIRVHVYASCITAMLRNATLASSAIAAQEASACPRASRLAAGMKPC